MMLEFCHWLEATQVGTLVRESLYGFPILVGMHLMALTLSVGMIVWFDLRLIGVALRRVPVSVVYRRVIPWATAGFLLMFCTGSLLFIGYAAEAVVNAFFRVKVAALVLAGVNALLYHAITERRLMQWDTADRPPAAARAAGFVSMAAWATVLLCGRLMAYTMY